MIFNMADGIITPCNVAWSWHWFRQVTAPCNICGMWLCLLWNHDSKFTKCQHPAMWQVALGWHAMEFAQTSTILEFHICFDFDHITAVDMSFCTSLRNFTQIGPPSTEKNNVTSIFKMADLSHLWFYGSNMGSLKSLCTTSYRSSIDTIALNCLVFEKIAFLQFGDRQTNRKTDKQTNRRTRPSRAAAW